MKNSYFNLKKFIVLTLLIGISLLAYATKKQLNENFTDTNNKVWAIKGWIEYDICCPPSITHWDVWLWDPYSNKWIHFTGYPAGGEPGGNDEEGCITGLFYGNGGYTTHITDSLNNGYNLHDFNPDLYTVLLGAANTPCQ